MKTALELRELVINNQFELNRLSAEQLGSKDDYNAMTVLYKAALDAITLWATRQARHTATKEHRDGAFNAVKAILNLYTTEDNRIIIDEDSLLCMRDRATTPKKKYSKEYTSANKTLYESKKQAFARLEELIELGAPKPSEEVSIAEYTAQVRTLGLNTVSATTGLDTITLFENAWTTYKTAQSNVERIKSAGKWTWREIVPVAENTFADLIENYIADCLTEGYNIKTSEEIRAERAARRAENRKAK